jgi:hypothetical protein
MKFCYLAFCGNNVLMPSWYIMINLSKIKDNKNLRLSIPSLPGLL